MTPTLMLLLGLTILTVDAEVLVRGASAIALRLGLSQLDAARNSLADFRSGRLGEKNLAGKMG